MNPSFILSICLLLSLTQQACNPSVQMPPLTLYTGETFRYYLLDYFTGSSMSFTTSSTLGSYSRIVPSYNAPQTQSNTIPPFISYKLFKSEDSFYQSVGNSMAFLIKNSTTYYVQAFTPQTSSQQITNLTVPIYLNGNGLPTDAICYDLSYISIGQVLVDCYSPSTGLNYLVPVSLSAQTMLNNTRSFPEYTPFNSSIAAGLKRNLVTVSMNNQIYVLRYAYSQQLGNKDTYIAVFNIKQSATSTFGPTIYQFPPISAASFGQSHFYLQSLVLKGQFLFIYDSSMNQIYKTQLTFQGLTIKLPQLGNLKLNLKLNNSVGAMDAFYDGQNYTLIYGLTNSGIYEYDWTTTTPYLKSIYPLNPLTVNLNRLVIGQQFIMTFFNNNQTTSVMEIYLRGSVSYPMIQFYNTSFFGYQSVLDMDQISGVVYSFGNSQQSSNTNQMIQVQLPFLEFKATTTATLTNFSFNCQTTYNSQTSSQASSSLPVQTLQSGSVSITSKSGGTVPNQALYGSYPGQAYDDLARFYKGPGLQYTFKALNNWKADARIANIDNYVSKANFKFVLSNNQVLDPATIIYLKQIQLASGVYLWYVQDTSNVMYTFVQNYESDEEFIEQYQFSFKWSDKAINIEWLEPWITPLVEGTTCTMYFYNIHSETLFEKSLCDSSKYQITYFNLIGNQLYVSINDKNSSSTNRKNGFILTANIQLSDFTSYSAFNLIQWTQFSALQSLNNFYPQLVYQPWSALYPIIYIQAEQSTIVLNTQYNLIYKTITPSSTPYQLSFSRDFLVLIQTSAIEQYQIYDPYNIYKTINYPIYSNYQNTPCFDTTQKGLAFSENLTLVYDKCNSQIVVFSPQKDENQVSQYLIPVSDMNFFTIARTYKVPNVISILGKHSLNLINYYQFQFLGINSYFNPQSTETTQAYYFQIIVSSLFSSQVTQTISYSFYNTLNPLYSIHQSSTASIDYGNYLIEKTNQSIASYQISPYQWYQGMIANFTLSCQLKGSNSFEFCGNLANVTNTFSKNRTIGGVPTYFQALAKGKKFNYAQSKNKLFRIYNYTNNFFDFVQLPFNTKWGGACYAVAVSDNEQFAISACLNGTWRLYLTSFLSSEPTVAGSFEIQTPKTAWTIHKIIIKDLYVFIIFGGFSLKDGFDYVQILKLNFDQFSASSLFTPITNFTLKANPIYFGTEQIITSINIEKAQKTSTYRFFLTDYFGHLYTHLFTPLTPNAYFSAFLKFHLYFYLNEEIRDIKPLLTGFKIFDYTPTPEDTYTGVLAFSYYHSYEVVLTFSSTTQAFGFKIQNQYLQYGLYEFTGSMDIMTNPMNSNDGFVVMFAVLADRFVLDPNYANYPTQMLLAYDRTNNSYTAYKQTKYSYPQTILTGSLGFQSDEPTFAFAAQAFPSSNTQYSTNFSVLLINPDTYTLDNFYIKRYIQLDLDTKIYNQIQTLSLNAQNSLNYRNYLFSLQSPLSGGGKLSTQLQCSGYQTFNPLTTTTQEATRFNLLNYFSGPNIAYSVNASSPLTIPTFVSNLTQAASVGIVPHYVTYKTYKPWNAFGKEWKQQMAVLYYDYVTSNYAIQQYKVPTLNSSMQKVGSLINLNIYTDVICFDLEYLDQNTLIVDCHSPTKYRNYFIMISNILSSPTITYQNSTPYQSLTSPPLHRHLFYFQRSQNVGYIFRCQYAEDYSFADLQLSGQTYIEQFSYSNQKIYQLFPITSSLLSLQYLKIDQLIVNPMGQLFILTQKIVYKLDPSYLGISLAPFEIDTYTSQYITNIQRMAVNFNGTSLILYLSLQLTDNNFYIQEIDWTTSKAMKLTNRISLNNQLAQVTQMSVSNDFIIIAYNNQNYLNYGSYLDIYEIKSGTNIYQTPFSNQQNFTHDRFNNYLLILDNTRTSSANKQFMYQISMPYLFIWSTTAASMQTYSIGCTSSYYVIQNYSDSQDDLQYISTSPQATESIMLTIKTQDTVQLTSSTAGVYQALAQSQAPGQGIMNLNQFYYGPAIQYTFQGTGASATWPTDTKIYSFDTVYQSSSFIFKDKDQNKTISVDDIIFFQSFAVAPDFFFWFIQDKTYTMYMFAEIIVNQNMIQLEPHPYPLSSQLLQIQIAEPDISIVLEQKYNCTLYFYNRKTQTLFSQNFCNSSASSYINSFQIVQNILYVMVQNGGNSFISQIFFNKYNFHNNTAFGWLDWNYKLTSTSFLNIQQLQNFEPQQIYQSTLQPNIVVLKCSTYVLIFDQYTYHIYHQIIMKTSYQIAVTANDILTIIHPTRISEYNFQNPLTIFETKPSYPSYAGSSFSTQANDIQRTDKFVYIRQPSSSRILVIQPGNPMLYAVQNTIPLTTNYKFFAVEKSFDNIFETVAILGTNSIKIYNFYIQKSLEISAQNSKSAGNLTFSLAFQSQFEASPSHTLNFTFQQTPNTEMFSIAQKPSATIDYAGFINIESFSGQGTFTFQPHQWYSGIITNYAINCSQSCQNNVFLKGPLGLQRQITKQPYFVDVRKGKQYTYAQSENKVYRLSTYMNQIFDMVPLPFSTLSKKCHSLSVAPSEYYTLSACFDEESWYIYMVSYLSSEPHVAGYFKDVYIKNVNNMIILNNYLFVIDGGVELKDEFNGIHIFYLNFTATTTYRSWINYVDTFTLDKLSSYAIVKCINSIDIQVAELSNSYRFFLADSSNYLHTVIFQETQSSNLEFYLNQQSLLITHYLDTEAQKQKNIEFIGVKVFNTQNTPPQASYSMLLVFKNFHSYETKISFSTHVVQNILVNKYLLNGFYQSQTNFDVISSQNDGFFILQGILPQRIAENSSYSSLPQQVLMVYDRTNASFTQTQSSSLNNVFVMASYEFNTLDPIFKFAGQIYPGTITNYSILAISPLDRSFNNLYIQRSAQFFVSSLDFNDTSLDLILSNSVTNSKFTFNVTKEQGQNGTLAQTQCVSTHNFSSMTLGVSEYYKFNLKDYFEGENLQFTIQPAGQTMINIGKQFTEYPKAETHGILNEFNYISIAKTIESSLVAWDNYCVTLTQPSFTTPSYILTKYILPTENSQMAITGPQIRFTLSSGQQCFEVVHVTPDIAVVDCIDMVNQVNKLIIADFSKNTYTVQTQPWLQVLTAVPYWRHLHPMATSTGMIYLYRTIYKEWYSSKDQPQSSQGYIEVFSFNNGKISELFPFTATTFGLTLLEIQQIWVNQISLYVYDTLSNKIYSLSPTFQGLSYQIYSQDSYTVQGNFMKFCITFDGSFALIATTVNSINYVHQVNWKTKQVVAQYYLNSNIQVLQRISGTSNFFTVEYNNGKQNLQFIGYIDIYEIDYPRVLYQRQISPVEFYLYNPFKNQIMIVYNTQQQKSNFVSLYQLSQQQLILSATQAATQQQVTIECQSVYYNINQTQSLRRELSPAVNIQFDFTVEPANSVVINQVTPASEQTLYTQYPGTMYFGLNYYQGPLLKYMIQNTSLPTNTDMTLQQNFQLYSNSQFNFTIGGKTLYPNDVTNFFDQIFIEPGVFLWVFQDKSYNTYKELIDIRSGEFKMIDMPGAQQSLQSNLINLQKVFPFIVAFALQGEPCTLYFANLEKGQTFSRSFCTAANEKIQNFHVFENHIYVYTTQSNIYTASLNLTQFFSNSGFQSIKWAKINSLILDSAVQTQINNCKPQKILIFYEVAGVYAIQCASSVIIMNLQTLVYYGTITPKVATSFIPSIVQSYLLLVEPTNIEEYSLVSLTNIYKTKDYPNYQTSTLSYTKVTACYQYVAIYEANSNTVYIAKPGQSIFSVIVSSISVPSNVFFMQCMPGVEQSILTVISTATGGGAVNIYKLYENYPQFVMDFGLQNQGASLNAKFALQISSSISSAKALAPINFNTIATNQTELTISLDKNQPKDFYDHFLNLGYSDNSYFFDFKQQQYYHGLILNFYINCTVQSECNSTIRMNNVIDWQRTIARTKTFTDVAQGNTGKFAYAQSTHEIWRFLGYMDELYDMVQLPLANPNIYCTKLAVNELDQFAVSACSASDISSDFATPMESFWELYVVSYLSTEPFTMGNFPIQAKFINKMVILDKYLFVFDADASIAAFFNGIHVYQFNFDNFTLYPTWYQYVGTISSDQVTPAGANVVFTSFDVVKTSIKGRYRFVFSTSRGEMITQTYDLTAQNPFANYKEYFTIYVNTMMNNQNSQNSKLQSITLFNLQQQTQQTSGNIVSQYNALFVFQNISSYEAKLTFNEQQQNLHFDFITEYIQYGYYQSQPNPKVVDDFILFSGVLPEHLLLTAPSTTAKQVLFVYQRNNASGTQFTNLGKSLKTMIPSSGYPFYSSLNQFAYSPQSFYNRTSSKTNYSILMVNPDTKNLDRFWLKQNLTFEFVSDAVQSTSIDLYARNDFMNVYCGKFQINIGSSQNGTLANTQCVAIKNFSSMTLGVSEYYEFKLKDYFQGENLQFIVSPANQTMININKQFTEYPKSLTQGVLNQFNYISIAKTINSSLVAWDNYCATLTQLNTLSYMLTKYILPTENSQMAITGPQISFTLSSGQQCFEVVHVTPDIAVVDCIDMVNQVNQLIIADFSKNTYTVQTQPWLQALKVAPTWRHLHPMATSTGMIYLYRTIYKEWYSTQDEPLSSQGYIEVFSFNNGKISELFPFTATTFGLTLLEIQQIWVNQISLYVYDTLSNKIYSLSPTFKGLTYPIYQQDSYTVQGNFMKFCITFDGSFALIATTVNSINYVHQVNWKTKQVVAQYYLNSNIQVLQRISGTSDFFAVEYNNGKQEMNFVGYIDFYQINSPRVLYQKQTSSLEYYLYNPFKNQIMIMFNTQQQKLNYVSLYQLTTQSLILSATQAATQQQVNIECQSIYYTLNETQYLRRALSPAANIQFDFTVEPANTVVINQVIPPSEQTLYTQYPGTMYFGLNYYQGPLLKYMIQNTSLPTNTDMTLQQNFQLYSNSQFNFTIGGKTLYPNDVTNFFDQIFIEPGVFLWVFQDKSYNTYKELIDIRSGEFKMIDMPGAQQSLQSNLINLQKVFPFIVAFALQGEPCTLYFANLEKGQTFSRSFCTAANEKIQNFHVFENHIYVYTTQSNFYTASLNLTQFFSNSGFQSIKWAKINSLILDSAVQTQINNCKPQKILIFYEVAGVYAIQCASSVIIMNLQTLVYYGTITPKVATSFIPSIVQSYLLLVEPTNIEEYSLVSLTNIYKTKDYPNYQTSTLSYTKVTACYQYVAIYEANSNTVYIAKPGQSIFSVIVSSISVPSNVFFMQCMPGVEQSILTVISTATGGGAVNIYKLYENYPQFVMDFGIHNGTNLGAQFSLQVSSSLQSSKALTPIKFNTIATNQTELTITLDKNQPENFYDKMINLDYKKDTSYFFDFKQQQYYHGLILNFYINCTVQSECNSTIRMNNVIDWQRTIARTKTFTDVAQGNTGKFAYAQSTHEIWRFLGYMDELYDMVQLPLANPNIYCTKLAVNELDQFAVSACSASDISSDFATPMESFWELYVVSYLSTEPFTMGNFPIQAKFINKMVILDKYLFVFDADASIAAFFNGIHVYQFNFDNFTLYPTWYQYVGTISSDQVTPAGANVVFTSFDVVKTSIKGRYRFVFSTSRGEMITQTYDLTAQNPFANYKEYFTIYVNTMMNNQNSQNSKLQSITLFNLQQQTQQTSGNIVSQYNALFVFQNISSYEAKLTFNEQQQNLHFDFITEYIQYGYYQSQPNPKVVDDFILFSGVLPEHLLLTAPSTTAKQVLFVYQRNNASGTQFTNLGKSLKTMIPSSGYPFYSSLNQFAYSPQSFYNRTSSKTNYSILMVNPDTKNLDRFWLKQNLTFEFVNNSIKSTSIKLYARNDFMNVYCGQFSISIKESPGGGSSHPYWVIGVVLGSVALVAIIVVMYIYYRKKKNAQMTDQEEPLNQ